MPSTIYLIRHAESLHNPTHDFSLRDPGLTPLGHSQSLALGTSFPALDTTRVILTSPLTRTLETTLAAFGPLLTNNNSNWDTKVKLLVDPDLQERSALPCDTGSSVATLLARFPTIAGAIQEGVPGEEHGEWFVKEGRYTADDEAVKARAGKVRERIAGLVKELDGGDVVVVTHGVFMKFLAEDEGVDLPKAGWKAYVVEEREGGVRLVAV